MEEILQRFKTSLGIKNEAKDSYFLERISAEIEELSAQGIEIDDSKDADIQLVADIVEFNYLNAEKPAPLPPFITSRIARRKTKARCGNA